MKVPNALRAKILLLAGTLLFIFFVGEIAVRIYAASTGTVIGANDVEITKKSRYDTIQKGVHSQDLRFIDHPLLGRYPNPNQQIYYYVHAPFNGTHKKIVKIYHSNNNAQGMRMLHDVNKTKSDKLRIAVLGDSFTWGDDVSTRHTYSSLLEAMIPNSEVLNFGRGGVGLTYMYLVFKNQTIDYNPDVLIMSIFIDDISRDLRNAFAPFLKVNNSGGLELKGVPIPSEAEFLQQYKPTFIESYFLDFLVYRASLIKKKERAYEYGFTLLGPILDELKKSMAGKPFIVTIFRKNRDDDAQRKLTSISYLRLREALVDKGIPYVDGEEVFQREYIRYGQNESIFFVKKAHFNELGNAVFAHAIKNKLEELSIINKIKLCYSFLGEYVFSDEGPFLTNLSCLNETKTTEWQVANYDVLSIEPFACSAREMILGIC